MNPAEAIRDRAVRIPSDAIELEGTLAIPENAVGIVLFAHGSGSSRLSPRNRYVARALEKSGIGTLLFDLLTEQEARDRENVFDIDFLAHRLADATRWLRSNGATGTLPIGYFGASTGAAAALMAAARDVSIGAVVSRGGRPDLALRCLDRVTAPTLLIVGGNDEPVVGMNRQALARLRCEKALEIVPGATHLFEEPGALDEVVRLARNWFLQHLERAATTSDPPSNEEFSFDSRIDAGRRLAARLLKYKEQDPVVLAIPRGGVPVAFEVARVLDAPLDVVIVRKLGAPGQPELGIGAVVDGDHPQEILNRDIIDTLDVSQDYLGREIDRQILEIERRHRVYRGGRARAELTNRTVIIVDDGIATGGSIRAAVRGVRRAHPRRVVIAVPVAPASAVEILQGEADEVVCLMTPESFFAIGQFYVDFHQLTDDEVTRALESAGPQAFASRPRAD